jgi:hypothetical protein
MRQRTFITTCEPRAVRERQVSRWFVFLFNERSDITVELTERGRIMDTKDSITQVEKSAVPRFGPTNCSPPSEFGEWAKRFGPREYVGWTPTGQKKVIQIMAQCMYPIKEGPHMRAHHVDAIHGSVDGYPACAKHAHLAIRPAWRGYVKGA